MNVQEVINFVMSLDPDVAGPALLKAFMALCAICAFVAASAGDADEDAGCQRGHYLRSFLLFVGAGAVAFGLHYFVFGWPG